MFLGSDTFWYTAKREKVSMKHFYEALRFVFSKCDFMVPTEREKEKGELCERLGTLSGSLRPRNKILMRGKHELPKSPAAHPSLGLTELAQELWH